MAGYSGAPLAKKLGIKPGSLIFTSGAPDTYLTLPKPQPADVRFARSVPTKLIWSTSSRSTARTSIGEAWSGLKLVVRKELR